jgi:nitrogen fixation protein FixH
MDRRTLVVILLVLAFGLPAAAQSAVATLTLTTKPSPLGLGQNLFEVSVKDAKGRPVTDATVALVLLMPADPKTKHPEMRTEGTLNNAGGGTYSGIAIVTMAGDWDVTVTASRNGKQIGQKKQKLTAYLKAPSRKK